MQFKTLILILSSATAVIPCLGADPVDYVNPIIGTNGMGHTFPGACAPFGIVQLSPDTENIPHNINGKYQGRTYEYCAGYQHADSTIVGFSHTHLSGTGHSDLGDIMLMPTTGELHLTPGTADKHHEGYRSAYSHDTEVSKPGYYAVNLDDYGIKAELTATPRVGLHRYTYTPGTESTNLILDMDHAIYNYDGKTLWTYMRVEDPYTVTGYRITNGWAATNYTYFAMKFSEPVAKYGYTDMQKPLYTGFWRKFKLNENFPEIAGRKIVAYFNFDIPETQQIEVQVALSGVSTAGALANLKAETLGKSFDEVAAATRADWNLKLSSISAQGTDDQLAMFYTSLYHTMINPSVYMDVDGNYRGLDHNIHHADDFTNYTVFSIWDTFRAEHPLMNVLFPERSADMVKSMVKHYEQSAHHVLPVWSHMGNENWCMIGYHAVSVLADAYAKNSGLDGSKLYEAMDNSANLPYYEGIKDYTTLGYVPFDHNGSAVSVTLEYAYDDWCIYMQALRNGDTENAERYRRRALNYLNVFDDEISFSRPRYSDGSWKKEVDLIKTSGEGYLEGNALNYAFFVPHDISGLMKSMGGDKTFIANIDRLFTSEFPEEAYAETEDVTKEGLIGCYVHGNEPSHHIPYLYMWTSQPWKSQYWVREIMNRMYRNNIDGLCGNDDCGQMSAWYIFSALGFYPVCPGTDQYVLAAPYMPYACLNLTNGKTLEIKAPKVSDKNRYVKEVRLNGTRYDKAYITHDDIMNGGILEFVMSDRPNKSRCIKPETKPYSLSDNSI
ncbi:MAG: GH92 family glycosyl hydrolase [Clostridiales bacterium]|nr:GH92 family glycosyl hydrolase [Clostridiales bacterium]